MSVKYDRYVSIKNIFKKDGTFFLPEFECLQDCQWIWTEKLDGMNIRVVLDDDMDNVVEFLSRRDETHIPKPLLKYLRNTLDVESVREQAGLYGEGLCLYGEGVGSGIRKGAKYGSKQFFVLFDVQTDYGWVSRPEMLDIAARLGVPTAPVVFVGTVAEAIKRVRWGLGSEYGPFFAEGLVGRPCLELRDRYGQRIMTKIKHRNFFLA
jgi:hypothetical protein